MNARLIPAGVNTSIDTGWAGMQRKVTFGAPKMPHEGVKIGRVCLYTFMNVDDDKAHIPVVRALQNDFLDIVLTA